MKRLLVCLLLVGVVGCGESEKVAQSNANLTACPDCMVKVSKRAAACPHCGADLTAKGIGMTFNEIPAGTFMMGSAETEKGRDYLDDEQQHKVTITTAFYMQTTEVTQSQWKAVMGTEPFKGVNNAKEGPDYPATSVTWNDAVAFCKVLSAKEGKTYRLPTEAEWEYACRAGTETRWSFGDDKASLGDYAWYDENAYFAGEKHPHQVGLKKPNPFGLYDMHGNVLEWCHDYYGVDYYKQSPEKDPTGPASAPVRSSRQRAGHRVLRGGAWGSWAAKSPSPSPCRSANRGGNPPEWRDSTRGFRVVCELD